MVKRKKQTPKQKLYKEVQRNLKKIQTRRKDLYLAQKGEYKAIAITEEYNRIKLYSAQKHNFSKMTKDELLKELETQQELLEISDIKEVKKTVKDWRAQTSKSVRKEIENNLEFYENYRDYHQSFIFYDYGSEDAKALEWQSDAEALETFLAQIRKDEEANEEEMREGNFVLLSMVATEANVKSLAWELASQ